MTAPGSPGHGGERPRRPRRHPSRDAAGPAHVAVLAVAAAVAMGVSARLVAHRSGTDPSTVTVLGAVVGVLLVAGLPSLSVRATSRLAAAVAALLTLRLGVADPDPLAQAAAVVLWTVAIVTLVVGAGRVPRSAEGGSAPVRARPSLGGTARQVAAVSTALLVAVAVLSPSVGRWADSAPEQGREPRLPGVDEARPLVSPETLDMTRRPRLSDRLVLTVTSDRATFWRTDTFDRWDGRTWSRDEPAPFPVVDGVVDGPPTDLARSGDDVISQRFRIEATAAVALPAAAAAVRIEAPAPVFQRADGTVLVGALGAGAEYEVESRRVAVDEVVLRSADGPVPTEVRSRWAAPPVATDRVVAAAREAVRGVDGTYDRVRALEAWMGARTRYSLDAPLAPEGVDVVDHFLFTSREGWCEQIASSLVVLARAVGIPARLVSGYVPGERDPLRGTFSVRERDAHAWAEVWFPEVGWVPFDPTASVPFAGEDRVEDWTSVPRRWLPLALGAVAVAGVLGLLARVLLRALRRWRDRRPSGPEVGVESALERLGASAGRPRAPAESATRYAAALADHLGVEDLREVGAYLDDGLYAPDPPPPEARARAEAALSAAAPRR